VLFKQGQTVLEGQTLVQIDPRPYQAAFDQAAFDQALAKKASDEANLKNAQLNLGRYKTLGEEKFAPQQQIDTQQASVDQVQAQIKGDQAAIDNAQTQLSYATIKSPLTGRAGFRLVDPGDIVHASATSGIVTVVKLQPISVVFTAPEEDGQAINDAQAAGVMSVDANSADGRTLISHGHLAFVNNEVDQASGDIRMKATYANTDNKPWPGLSVSTRLLLKTIKNAVIAPADAVQRGPEGLFVWVVEAGNKFEMADVNVDREGPELSLIASELKEGETVLAAGQSRLAEGVDFAPVAAPTPEATDTLPPDQPELEEDFTAAAKGD